MTDSVLVVDDDPMFRALVARMLTAGGLNVVAEAESVAAALAAAHAHKPDAALVDVGLPDGDGVVLAKELLAMPWRPRVLLTSTDPDAARRADVHAMGTGAFVPKDELPGGLRRLFDGS